MSRITPSVLAVVTSVLLLTVPAAASAEAESGDGTYCVRLLGSIAYCISYQ